MEVIMEMIAVVLILFIFCIIWLLATRPVSNAHVEPIEISNNLVYFHDLDFKNQLEKYKKKHPEFHPEKIEPILNEKEEVQAYIVTFKRKWIA